MTLSKQQMQALIQALSLTRDRESNCDECLSELAEFADNELQGKSVPQSLKTVEHHLALCGECREEYEALLRALRQSESDS